jgi:hypothetical protein
MEEVQISPKTGKPKRKPRGKPMTGLDDPRHSDNVLLARSPPVEYEAGVPALLSEMIFVTRNVRGSGESAGVTACRSWLRSDVKGFMATRAKMEQQILEVRALEAGSGKVEADVGEVLKEDVGTDVCVALCEKLMGEWASEARDAVTG